MRLVVFACVLSALAACSPPTAQAPAEPTGADAARSGVTIVVNAPRAGARVTSPLRVEGTAPGDWFFEAVFPAELRGADGALIAEAPAEAQRRPRIATGVDFPGARARPGC